MKTTLTLSLVMCCSLLVVSGFAKNTHAAPLRTFQFAARLVSNSTGYVVTEGTYPIRFTLYNQEFGGSPLWSETQNITLENGLISALLGSVTPFPDTIDFNDARYFLGIKVGNDQEMAPRQEIAPVIAALNADRLRGSEPGTGPNNIVQLDGTGSLNLAGNITTSGTVTAGALQSATINGGTLTATAVNGVAIASIVTNNGTYQDPAWIDSLSSSKISGTLAVTQGGTGLTAIAAGDLLYGSETNTLSTLTKGDAGSCLMIKPDGSTPWWSACPGGTASSLQSAYSNGNAITTSSARDISITLADTAVDANFVINIEGTSGGKFAVQHSGVDILTVTPSQVGITGSNLVVSGTINNATISGGSLSGTAVNGVATADIIVSSGSYANPAWITSLSVSKLSGTLPLANGGTGGTDASSARANLGLGSVENTALSAWTGSTNLTMLGTIATGAWNGTAIAAQYGGTGQTSVASGDLLYGSAVNTWGKLAKGNNGQCLVTTGGLPTWGSCAGTGSGVDLQSAYTNGNTIVTGEARDLSFTLADTVSDSNFLINIATDSTGKFAVQNNGTDVFSVTSSGVTFAGNQTTTGTINSATITGGSLSASAVNGVTTADILVSTGNYVNPTWISSLAGSKISSDISHNAVNVTGVVAIANGGTGANNIISARTNLGLAIGSDIQAYSARISEVAALTPANGGFIVGNGTSWTALSGATARTALGLGSVEDAALSTWGGSTNLVTVGGITTGTWSATEIAATKGGTGLTTVVTGDLLYGSAANTWNRLALGGNGACLTSNGTTVLWGSCAGSGSGVTLQAAYTNGNTVITSDARDISFTLANTDTDSNYLINIANGSNGIFAIQDNGTDIVSVGTTGLQTAKIITSSVATGTAPMSVASATLVTNFNSDYLDGHHASDFVLSGSGLSLASLSSSDPITYNSSTGSIGLAYNSTNLQITSNQLNTIQDISATSSPTFAGLTLTTGAAAGKILVADASGNATWQTPSTAVSSAISNVVTLDTAQTITGAKAFTGGALVRTDTPTLLDQSSYTNSMAQIGAGSQQIYWVRFNSGSSTTLSAASFQVMHKTTDADHPAAYVSAYLYSDNAGAKGSAIVRADDTKLQPTYTHDTWYTRTIGFNRSISANTWYWLGIGVYSSYAASYQVKIQNGLSPNGNTYYSLNADATASLNNNIGLYTVVYGASGAGGAGPLLSVINPISAGMVSNAPLLSVANEAGTVMAALNDGTVTLGSVTSGVWQGTSIGVAYGGTGLSSYTTGDLLYASGSTAISKLADVATGSALISGGVGVAPSWGKITLGTATTGNYVATIAGTANQITASASTGAVTLSLPQDIAGTSLPTFAGMTLNGNLSLGANTLTTTNTTVVANFNADQLDGYHSSDFALAGSVLTLDSLSGANPLTYNSATGQFGLAYNTTNLQLTASQLNTIQDISATSSPTFAGLTLTTGAAAGKILVADASGNATWQTPSTAVSSAISNVVTLDTAQTITGAKAFNNQTSVNNSVPMLYESNGVNDGYTTIGSSKYRFLIPWNSGSNTSLSAVSFYIKKTSTTWDSNSMKAYLYSDNGGSPQTALASTTGATFSTLPLNSYAWTTVNLSASLTENTNYWIGLYVYPFSNTEIVIAATNDASASFCTGPFGDGPYTAASTTLISGKRPLARFYGSTGGDGTGPILTVSNPLTASMASTGILFNVTNDTGIALAVKNDLSVSVGGQLVMTSAPTAAATTSLIQIGSAISGGSASGTYLGLNSAGGYAGNLADLQVGGSSKLSVSAAGALTLAGGITVNTNKFTVAAATGNTVVGGTLTSTGSLTLGGNPSINTSVGKDLVLMPGGYSAGSGAGGRTRIYGGDGTVTQNTEFVNTSGVTTVTVYNSGNITSSGVLQGTRLVSTVATGTAPLTVTSSTVVANFNADQLDGYHSSDFALAGAGGISLTSLSSTDPITYNNTTGAFGLAYNATNLRITSNALNTIQDIATSSTPTFAGLALTGTPAASATASLFQMGSAISGGNAAGTYLGLNAANGYSGNLVDLQVNGSSKFSVDSNGALTLGDHLAMQGVELQNIDSNLYWGKVKLAGTDIDSTISSSPWDDWTPRLTQSIRETVAMSATGRYQLTGEYAPGYLYTSNDFGVTWVQKASSLNWYGTAVSANGKYQTATANNDHIYVSSDYGATWTSKGSALAWRRIAMSADGKYQTATVYNGAIYVSSDYGATWASKASTQTWFGITLSADGKYQTATVFNGNIYVSSDYGATWVQKASSRGWREVAMSADGKIQTAVVNAGFIYISTDYGATWVQKASSQNWWTVAVSADGRYQTAGTRPAGYLYVSSDYGTTWTQKSVTDDFSAVAMSGDGTYQTAVSDGYLYTYVAQETTYFSGLQVQAPTGYAANLLDLKVNAVSKFSVSATGSILYSGTLTGSGALKISSTTTGANTSSPLLSLEANGWNGASTNQTGSFALQTIPTNTNLAKLMFSVTGFATANVASLNQAGNWVTAGTQTASSTPDIAEYLPTDSSVEAYDVVTATTGSNSENFQATKNETRGNPSVLGVISDGTSAFKINSYGQYIDMASGQETGKGKPLVLAGRVQVKVTAKGGAIHRGDLLMPSDKPGYVEKFDPSLASTVAILGVALGDLSQGDGLVLTQVQVSRVVTPEKALSQTMDSLHLTTLTVKGTAAFEGTIVAKEDATFEKSAFVKGKLAVGKDAATSTLDINGSLAIKQRTVTDDYTLTDQDYAAFVDATEKETTITLPSAADSTGRQYVIKKTDTSANNVIVRPAAGQTIEGSETYVLPTRFATITIMSDGQNWMIVNKISMNSFLKPSAPTI